MTQVKTISQNEEDSQYLEYMKSNGKGVSEIYREALQLHKEKNDYQTINQLQEKIEYLEKMISEATLERDGIFQQILELKPKQETMERLSALNSRRDKIGPLVAAIKLSAVSMLPANLSRHSEKLENMSLSEKNELLLEHAALTEEFKSLNQIMIELEGGIDARV